jgi:rod shape determining protein RodA
MREMTLREPSAAPSRTKQPFGFFPVLQKIDWVLFFCAVVLSAAGLVTMNSFAGEDTLFGKQIIWVVVSVVVFMMASLIDWRFLRRTGVVVTLFAGIVAVLGFLLAVGSVFQGAQSWFNFGLFVVQPSEIAKLILIIILAKYFSRRHIEIANFRHIIVSGIYAFILFALIFLQGDFGSGAIVFFLWLGMTLVSGISKKHLLLVFLVAAVAFGGLWSFAFTDNQQDRILSFLHPLADLQGAGYNAYQSTVAVGSGQLTGKGVGFGTQSKLKFLPEYETDFIFAAFAEEWGFFGVVLLFAVFGVLFWRILANAVVGATNFEVLFGAGIAVLFMSHFLIHVGMNIGLLPVTGTTIPFLSYGGSHLVMEFAALGILMGMRNYSRAFHREDIGKEFLGV